MSVPNPTTQSQVKAAAEGPAVLTAFSATSVAGAIEKTQPEKQIFISVYAGAAAMSVPIIRLYKQPSASDNKTFEEDIKQIMKTVKYWFPLVKKDKGEMLELSLKEYVLTPEKDDYASKRSTFVSVESVEQAEAFIREMCSLSPNPIIYSRYWKEIPLAKQEYLIKPMGTKVSPF